MLNIRNREAFMDSLWDWSILEGCFVSNGYSGIRPKDLDGSVERNGFFLHLEGKPASSYENKRSLQPGELRYIKNRVGSDPFGRDTFLVIWGQPPLGPIFGFEIWYPGGYNQKVSQGDLKALRRFCAAWFARADRGVWRWMEAD